MKELDKRIIDNLQSMGITEPTTVQSKVMPLVREKKDLIAMWKTGSGKTIAYLAPIIDELLKNRDDEDGNKSKVLVLAPTRELAIQIKGVSDSLCRGFDIKTVSIYGGETYDAQKEALRGGCDIIVATPGRLEDMMEQGEVKIDTLRYYVMDEVDQMVTLGFREAIERISSHRRETTQSLSFSATVTESSMMLIESLIADAEIVKEEERRLTVGNVKQRGYWVEMKMMERLLVHVVREEREKKMIVFTRSKKMADKLTQMIIDSGISAEAMHSDKSQKAREWILDRFRTGENRVLVATDIVARGIDISDVETVVNYGLPLEEEQYVHRIGRAARGREGEGEAILLCPPEEKALLDKTCSYVKQHVDMTTNHPFVTIELTRTMMGDALRWKDTSGNRKKKKR